MRLKGLSRDVDVIVVEPVIVATGPIKSTITGHHVQVTNLRDERRTAIGGSASRYPRLRQRPS